MANIHVNTFLFGQRIVSSQCSLGFTTIGHRINSPAYFRRTVTVALSDIICILTFWGILLYNKFPDKLIIRSAIKHLVQCCFCGYLYADVSGVTWFCHFPFNLSRVSINFGVGYSELRLFNNHSYPFTPTIQRLRCY